jgi:hypothetical protein
MWLPHHPISLLSPLSLFSLLSLSSASGHPLRLLLPLLPAPCRHKEAVTPSSPMHGLRFDVNVVDSSSATVGPPLLLPPHRAWDAPPRRGACGADPARRRVRAHREGGGAPPLLQGRREQDAGRHHHQCRGGGEGHPLPHCRALLTFIAPVATCHSPRPTLHWLRNE